MIDYLRYLITGKLSCIKCNLVWETMGFHYPKEMREFVCPECFEVKEVKK